MRKEITFDRFIRWAGIGLLVIAILLLMNYLSSVLLPFFVAWLLAYLVYPIVQFIENRLHIRVRALSILLTMLLLIVVIGGVFYLIIPPMIGQFDRLQTVLTRWVHHTTHTNDITNYISQWIQQHQNQIERIFKSKDFGDAIKAAMPRLFTFVGQTATVILSVIASMITLLYMFFILMDYEVLTNNWIRIFPAKNRPFWRELMQDAGRELNNYVRGQGLVALCMGIMFCIGFTIIGFPMAIGLGILIGILDLVPYLHTFALIPTAFLSMLKAADGCDRFCRSSGHHRPHCDSQNHGKSHATQPGYPATFTLCVGHFAGFYRSDCGTSADNIAHCLLATLCHQGRHQACQTANRVGRRRITAAFPF